MPLYYRVLQCDSLPIWRLFDTLQKPTMQEEIDKSTLRRALLAERQLIAAEVRRNWDIAIEAHVLAWWRSHRVDVVGVYWPMRAEPDLRFVYDRLTEEGVLLALPMAAREGAALGFAQWKPGDALRKDALGVSVPAANAKQVQPDALLIPCVGFNAQRQRLGYGGGYYDRTLAAEPRPATIGIAYSYCRCAFPTEPHDIALDCVITEVGVEG